MPPVERMRVLGAEAFDAINGRLPDTPWKQALRDGGVTGDSGGFENRRLGYFHLMLGCDASTDALDVGAGGGIVSSVIAGYCRSVVAVDSDPRAVEFMRHRFAQDGQDNVRVVQADALDLPFEPGSFDLIVLNGLLEWLPRAAPGVDPRRVQLDFLRRCAELLRHGGRICLAIENRLHFNFLFGRTPHGELPFVPVLPRFLGRALSRLAGRTFDTYTYSHRGVRRLLCRAGFAEPRMHLVLPTYYNPMLIVPTTARAVGHEVLSSGGALPKGRLRRSVFLFLSRVGVLRYLSHSFLALGEKRA